VSDERDGVGSAGIGTEAGADDEETGARGQTAVVTRPLRPTGKRSRRGAVSTADVEDTGTASETDSEVQEAVTKEGAKKRKKTAKKGEPRPNPFAFVWNYLKQVVAELRKVIWPNRKQMISYTTVVLVFLVFMVTLIGLVDLGWAKLVMMVFG
jgi:preprotein translocase subunit SecE